MTAKRLSERHWLTKYSPEQGDLVTGFYVPALECAVRYDRSTGYFSAYALALAARGIEGLVRNRGRMRLVVGCTLSRRARRCHPEGCRPARHGGGGAAGGAPGDRGLGGGRCPGAAGLDGRQGSPGREGCRALRRGPLAGRRSRRVQHAALPGPQAHRGPGPLPREGRHRRGRRGQPPGLQRQHQRDRIRLEAQLGQLPRLHHLGRREPCMCRPRRTASSASGRTRPTAPSSWTCRPPCDWSCSSFCPRTICPVV